MFRYNKKHEGYGQNTHLHLYCTLLAAAVERRRNSDTPDNHTPPNIHPLFFPCSVAQKILDPTILVARTLASSRIQNHPQQQNPR